MVCNLNLTHEREWCRFRYKHGADLVKSARARNFRYQLQIIACRCLLKQISVFQDFSMVQSQHRFVAIPAYALDFPGRMSVGGISALAKS